MEIKRIGSQPSGKRPAAYFAGSVRIDPLVPGKHDGSAVGWMETVSNEQCG